MKNPFWGNIFKRQLKESEANILLLKSCPLFRDLNYIDLAKLAQLFHLRTYFKNETIFHENEVGESMYLIKTGKVKVFSKNRHGNEVILAELSKTNFFGEVSLVDDAPRSATSIALEDTELLCFFRSDLMALIDRNPRLSSFFMLQLSKVVGQRLNATHKLLSETYEA